MSDLWRAAVSAGAALLLGLAALAALPDGLDVTTDIVGYPTFGDFDVDRLYRMYAIAVVLVPLAALVAFLVLTRAATGRFGPWGRTPTERAQVEDRPPVVGWRMPAVAAGRLLLVGGILGLEVAIWTERGAGTALLVAAGYAGLATAAAYAYTLGRRGVLDAARALNVAAAPAVVGGLWLVSAATHVTVAESGAEPGYPWLPWWLALAGFAAVSAMVLAVLVRTSAGAAREALERRVVLLVAAPVGVFLLVASLPGPLGAIEHFEEGQALAGAELTRAGAFPWRDLLPAHGLLHDVFAALVGFEVVEDSRWGAFAGERLVLAPLGAVGVYYLCAYLFGANWLYLAGTQALLVTGHLVVLPVRFLLLPAVLLLLAAVLRRPTAVRAAALAVALLAQAVLTPEALPLVAAVVGALVVRDAYHLRRGTPLRDAFRRTWLVLAAGGVLLAGWCLFLGAYGALDDWLFSYRAFIPGHRYVFGLPVEDEVRESVELWAPLAALLAAFALAAASTRTRRPFVLDDWAMLAAGAFTVAYFLKVLSRADFGHLLQTFAVVTPFLLYVAYRLVVLTEGGLAGAIRPRWPRWPARHTVTAPLLAVLLLTAPLSVEDVVRAAPTRFAATVEREPELARLGYDLEPANDEAVLEGAGRAVDELLAPGGEIFDFTNTPALFHYLAPFPASTRYYSVGVALRRSAQTDLVRELERSRPGVVVYAGPQEVGLSSWDGVANQVRHYDVSQYLLDTYVPVRAAEGFLLMQPRESGAGADPELYFRAGGCDWGHVPRFFAPEPEPGDGTAVELRPLPGAASPTWELTLPPDAARRYSWLELRSAAPLGAGRLELTDRLAQTREELLASRVRTAAENGVLDSLEAARAVSSVDTRRIAFEAPAGATTMRVRVGSCAQWHGYRAPRLFLVSTVPQELGGVRLLR